MTRRLGVVAVARSTFDLELAAANAAAALGALRALDDVEIVTSGELAVDEEALERALEPIAGTELDGVVLVQSTFADSTMAASIADTNPAPLVLWAIPEPRTGGRLRANSFCGINLAAYVLRRNGRDYRYVLAEPTAATIVAELDAAIDATTEHTPVPRNHWPAPDPAAVARATAAAAALTGATVGVIGERPEGFEPCDFDAALLERVAGVAVDPIPLPALFAEADAASSEAIAALRARVGRELAGTDEVDQTSLEASLKLNVGMTSLAERRQWSAFATRCWPECFTEFGGAACSAMSLTNSDGTPGCCEADVYGSVTSIMLQSLADRPAFVADLVDLDFADDTGVVWHCGLAPLEMAARTAKPAATVHSNRRKPLLNEFALAPGRVTIARLSQSRGEQRLVVGGGEMLDRPLPFAGTSGVIRFDAPARDVFATIMSEGLEHHYGLVYGDVRAELGILANQLDVDLVALA